MTQHQIKYDRDRLIKELAVSLGKASGYTSNVSDVNQWELTSDAIVRTIEGIVDYKLHDVFERYNIKPPFRDDRE
jgi:hypothetical protein